MLVVLPHRLLHPMSALRSHLLFDLSRSVVHATFHFTVSTVLKRLSLSGVPFSDIDTLNKLSCSFNSSRIHFNPLIFCVGFLDGIQIKIGNPKYCYIPRNYYCRKGFYAVHLQAIVDANCRFLSLSSVVCGSTHHSLAFRTSEVGAELSAEGLTAGYWIAIDDQYMCTESFLISFSSIQLQNDVYGIWREYFYFYQSSLRVIVEQVGIWRVCKSVRNSLASATI